MRMRLTHAAMACLLVILGAGGAAAQVVQWEVDGETREAIVYTPSSRLSARPQNPGLDPGSVDHKPLSGRGLRRTDMFVYWKFCMLSPNPWNARTSGAAASPVS